MPLPFRATSIAIRPSTRIDALQILRSAAGLSTTASCLGAGDVNCDAVVNSVDSLRVLRHVAALSNPATQGCPLIGEGLGERESGSLGQVYLVGASETEFNPLPSTVQLQVTGADLSADPLDVVILMNGVPLPASAYQRSGNTISGVALGAGAMAHAPAAQIGVWSERAEDVVRAGDQEPAHMCVARLGDPQLRELAPESR